MTTEALDLLESRRAQNHPDLRRTESRLAARGREEGYPTVSHLAAAQAHYVAMRMAGTGHALAEMLALQAAPQVRSDATFLAGHCNGSQFEAQPELGDWYKAQADAAGVDVTGAVYKSGLARFPGDPEAWVRGRGDVQRLCEGRGWGCDGDVKVKARADAAPAAGVDVAPDIVEQRVMHNFDRDPDLAGRCERSPEALREAFDRAKEEIKPSWAA